MKLLKNIALLVSSLVFFLGGGEWAVRTFAASKVQSYFEVQSEMVLGHPVPKKQPGEYRIFIFGGSSAYGFPVADRYSIAAWLRKSFPHLLPDKKVYVVNAAWPGKGSHHVLEGAHAVMKYSPDLFIIYDGHNDVTVSNRLFLDNWLYRLNLKLYFRSALHRFLSFRISRLRKRLVYGHSGYVEKHFREEVIAEKVYRKKEIFDSDYEKIQKGFRENVEALFRLARAHRVEITFLTLPSNMREVAPSFSVHRPDLKEGDLRQWNEWYNQGKEAEKNKEWAEAVQLFEKARGLDDTYAELLWRLGAVYEKVGRDKEARDAFVLARDLDRLPWRAKSSLNALIRNIAVEKNAILVDIDKTFASLSSNGVIGSDLIYDNVHPSIQAQQIIADDIGHALTARGFMAPSEKWQWAVLESAREDPEDTEWKVDGALNAYRYILRGIHSWGQGRYAEVIPDLEQGLKLMPKFLESRAFLADAYWRTGIASKAVEQFTHFEHEEPIHFENLLHRYPQIEESYLKSGASTHAS